MAAAARLTAPDIRNIEALAAQPDVLEVLARSLAPSIYGHHTIKLGLMLQLLGGRCGPPKHLKPLIPLKPI